MRRAALLALAFLAGCGRPAFDDPVDEAEANAPMPAGLAVKYIGEGNPPLTFMDDATVVSDPGTGGPARLIEVEINEGQSKGAKAKSARQDFVPANPEAWREEHGLPAKAPK